MASSLRALLSTPGCLPTPAHIQTSIVGPLREYILVACRVSHVNPLPFSSLPSNPKNYLMLKLEPSPRFFVFYSGTMPFLTLLHASLDLVLHFLALLNPLYALTGSLAFLTGWAVQLGFWTQCDITSNMNVNGGRGTCYQFFVEKTRDNGDLVGVPVGLANAKVAFGYMLLVL